MYYSWSRVISWLPVSVAAVILRRRFRQLKTWKNEHAKKKGKQQQVMREKSVLTVAKTFLFCFTWWLYRMATGCFSWHCSFSSCISISVVLPLRERVLCPQLIYHLLRMYNSPAQSVTRNVSSAPAPRHGMCLHTSQLHQLRYLILWVELGGESQSELALCLIHWICKNTTCRGRKSFHLQHYVLLKGKTTWQRQIWR